MPRCARAIAGPLTGNASLANAVRAEARAMLDQARAANANESAPNVMSQSCESLAVRDGCDLAAQGWPALWPRAF